MTPEEEEKYNRRLESQRKYKSEWSKRNRERVLESNRKYKSANRDKINALRRKRRKQGLAKLSQPEKELKKVEAREKYWANIEKTRAKNREKSRRARAKLTPEQREARRQVRRDTRNAKKARESKLRSTYGVSASKYNQMLSAQGGVCAICNEPERLVRRGILQSLSVDHCHRTGMVRGLLCSRCNRGMGLLLDNSDLCRKAAEYLDGYSQNIKCTTDS